MRRLARFAATAVLAAVPVGLVATPASAAPATPHPAAVPGDRHSPTVAALAAEALVALGGGSSTDHAALRASGVGNVYEALLMDTASATAKEVGVSARAMQLAWLASDRPHQVAVLTALTQLGAPYRSMSSDPEVGFDCSGLTSYAWGNAGVALPRPSGDQIATASAREATTAIAGDLVHYPGHVMLYLGVRGAVVHASNPENDVELWTLSENRINSVRYGDPTVAD